MRLSELLAALPEHLAPQEGLEGEDPVIRGIAYDSRAVKPGDLFVALRGGLSDGHDYLVHAAEEGAVALLVEHAEGGAAARLPAVCVSDARRALAPLAAAFFGHPSHDLELIGVTGTNGKTSTSILVESVLQAAGRRVGLIGTVGVRYADEHERAVNTTPESLDLQRTLRAMCTAGIETVAMEVSSHGLALGRVEDCRFRVAAMTNLSQDHLDFHETMEAYLEAKTGLFRHHLEPGGVAVVNIDDPSAAAVLEAAQQSGAELVRITRDASRDAEVALLRADVRLDGTRAELRTPRGPLSLEIPLIGDFNVENVLVAVGIATGLDVAQDAIARGVGACPQVPGRVERVDEGESGGPAVVVDYAHTPDAVEKLLASLRPLARGRLLTVFGCGGDRDRGKRPLMAGAVAAHSDRAIATSDNPRTEDPERILDDVETGLGELTRVEADALDATSGSFARIPDRRAAIRLAIAIARPEDTVVIAGKGHEDYQIVGRQVLPFDDRDEARRALRDGAEAGR